MRYFSAKIKNKDFVRRRGSKKKCVGFRRGAHLTGQTDDRRLGSGKKWKASKTECARESHNSPGHRPHVLSPRTKVFCRRPPSTMSMFPAVRNDLGRGRRAGFSRPDPPA